MTYGTWNVKVNLITPKTIHMAKMMFGISLDVTKIPKDKLVKGKKGTYLSLTGFIDDELNDYDQNISVWLEQSKEEREDKASKVYLGNGKLFWSDDKELLPIAKTEVVGEAEKPKAQQDDDDDLPF